MMKGGGENRISRIRRTKRGGKIGGREEGEEEGVTVKEEE